MNARELIVAALKDANAPPSGGAAAIQAFLIGQADIKLEDIEMDSLARMEFCISIEVNSGVSIVPDSLDEIASLARLAQLIEESA